MRALIKPSKTDVGQMMEFVQKAGIISFRRKRYLFYEVLLDDGIFNFFLTIRFLSQF